MIKVPAVSDVINEILYALRDMAAKGCQGFDCTDHGLAVLKSWKHRTATSHTSSSHDPEIPLESDVISCESLDGNTVDPEKADSLENIQTDIGDCRRCKLAEHRSRIVFGEGNPESRLMFVGEAPGFDEDQQGQPFVGKAGQLLTRIIQAINLSREQVYICNVIKCRPPGNRNPEPDEISACSPFLQRQIDVIQPEFICALGTFAAQTLLGTTLPISRLRGKFHNYNEIQLLPTFHPSYLLRNPEKKRDVWEDMKLLMNEMGL
jgi:uracil-DNA glycosylase